MNSKKKVQELLDTVGVEINGKNPWDIQVHNDKLYSRVLSGGSLAVGEGYMDKWWSAEKLDQFIERVMSKDLKEEIGVVSLALSSIYARIFNLQSVSRAFQVGEEHYDIGNDLYKEMLGKSMAYTCGYWSGTPKAQSLDEAQFAKFDLVCRKLNLQKGQRILETGCGWGSFAKYAAENYGVEVVGVTVSKEQVKFAQEATKGLSVEIRLQDYRDVNDTFDHVVSIGILEHVGYKNYRDYMEMVHRVLKDDGLCLVHTIGANKTAYRGESWHDKYIFPNGMLPSISQIGGSIEGLFVMEDWHNFGVDYDRTLMEWFRNFDASWPEFKDEYGERFYRMWKFYLLSMAGSFRARHNQLWQIVLSKDGVRGGYESVR